MQKNSHYKLHGLLNDLKKYEQKTLKKIKSKKEALTNAEELYNKRDVVIKVFESGAFSFKDEFHKKCQACLINHYQIG